MYHRDTMKSLETFKHPSVREDTPFSQGTLDRSLAFPETTPPAPEHVETVF